MKTLKEYATMVEARLPQLLPKMAEGTFEIGEMPWLLSESMSYSLTAGGKRLRPAMFLACVEMLGGNAEELLDFACTVEMIHTYSLIHDDLPGMDDDTLRRGRPTNHVVFGVGQAILAGDGLLNYAFETMLASAMKHPKQAASYVAAIREVAVGCGVTGMIAGQVMDLYCEHNRVADENALRYIQRNKTACMFIYPLRAAAHLCGATQEQIDALSDYGDAFGHLFQATDDLLDAVGDTQSMGKTLGKDADSGKLTCISIYGLDGTRKHVQEEYERAVSAMELFGDDAKFFTDLVHDMVARTH